MRQVQDPVRKEVQSVSTWVSVFPALSRWLYAAHPDVASVGPDSPDGYVGARRSFGGRRQYSFNSDTYATFAARIVTESTRSHTAGTEDLQVWLYNFCCTIVSTSVLFTLYLYI